MITRNPNRHRYVSLSKVPLEDTRLSWRARGIHAYLMSRPDNWNVIVGHLVNQSDKDGRDAVRGALVELERFGYIIRTKTTGEKGQYDGIDCEVFEEPGITPDKTGDGFTGDGFTGAGESPTNEYIELKNNESKESTSTDVDGPSPSRAKNVYDEKFEELWKVYPRGVNKKVAYDKFKARIRAGDIFEDILGAAEVYALKCKGEGTEEQFIQHLATFLSKDRWKEYLSTPEHMGCDTMFAAMAYDAYDQDEPWYDVRAEEDTFDNPALRNYSRPVNSNGLMINAEGRTYKLDAQGVRHYTG